jgi:hypothetical protein
MMQEPREGWWEWGGTQRAPVRAARCSCKALRLQPARRLCCSTLAGGGYTWLRAGPVASSCRTRSAHKHALTFSSRRASPLPLHPHARLACTTPQFQEGKAEKAADAIKAMLSPTAKARARNAGTPPTAPMNPLTACAPVRAPPASQLAPAGPTHNLVALERLKPQPRFSGPPCE